MGMSAACSLNRHVMAQSSTLFLKQASHAGQNNAFAVAVWGLDFWPFNPSQIGTEFSTDEGSGLFDRRRLRPDPI